jgi:pimeloyl-ACP methyl ester carboxylesterase
LRAAVVGHSFGGLPAQIVAGRGLSAAMVAIDPAPFRCVLPLPIYDRRDHDATEFAQLGHATRLSERIDVR